MQFDEPLTADELNQGGNFICGPRIYTLQELTDGELHSVSFISEVSQEQISKVLFPLHSQVNLVNGNSLLEIYVDEARVEYGNHVIMMEATLKNFPDIGSV